MQELMTLSQAASHLGISPNTVTAWAARLNIDLRLHPHDKRIKMLSAEEVEEIRQAIGGRNALLAIRPRALPPPASTPPPLPASSESRPRASQGHSRGPGLPEGYISLYRICTDNGIDLRDADDAIKAEHFTITEGEWQVGPNKVKRIMSPEQQAAFLEWLQIRRG